MLDKDSPPAVLPTAARAGNRVAGQPLDTANRSPAQPADPILGIRLRGFRPLAKGALIGFANIASRGGLLVHDCPAFRAKDGGAWASLPTKPVVDRDCKQKADVNGERQFAPMLEWRSRELGNRFSAAVIALIEYRASLPRCARRGRAMNLAEGCKERGRTLRLVDAPRDEEP